MFPCASQSHPVSLGLWGCLLCSFPGEGSCADPMGADSHGGGDAAGTLLSFPRMKAGKSPRVGGALPPSQAHQPGLSPALGTASSPPALDAGPFLLSGATVPSSLSGAERKNPSSILFILRNLDFCSQMEQISLKNYYGFCFSSACCVNILI